jgi:hypothetical protein
VLALIAWWQDRSSGFHSPHGALKYALSEARPQPSTGGLAKDLAEYFPPLDPALLQRVRDRQQSQREAELALQRRQEEETRLARLNDQKQLMLQWEEDFGERLDSMDESELASLVKSDRFILDALRRQGRKSFAVRPVLLKAMADFFKQTKGTNA